MRNSDSQKKHSVENFDSIACACYFQIPHPLPLLPDSTTCKYHLCYCVIKSEKHVMSYVA